MKSYVFTDYKLYHGDALEVLRNLPDESAQCCVTSPPYWGLRDYGVEGQLGLEKTPEEYVANIVQVFREVRRVLAKNGVLWLNIGDSYIGGGRGFEYWTGDEKQSTNIGSAVKASPIPQGLKAKDLCGIPWRVAFALQADGWWLRSDIIWAKPNPMPESVTDRPTKAHEYLFLLSKAERYYYDAEAIKEQNTWPDHNRFGNKDAVARRVTELTGNMALDAPEETDRTGRNKRSVWTVATAPYPESHFATYPPDLIKPCILAGSKPGDTILDPFAGSGTTGVVAIELGRKAALIELNAEYLPLIQARCNTTPGFQFA